MVSFLQGSSPCVKQWNLCLVQVVFDEHHEKVDVKNGKDRVLVGNGSFQKLNRSAGWIKESRAFTIQEEPIQMYFYGRQLFGDAWKLFAQPTP